MRNEARDIKSQLVDMESFMIAKIGFYKFKTTQPQLSKDCKMTIRSSFFQRK